MRIGLFLKYDREVGKWSENREIPDLWGRVDRYGHTAPFSMTLQTDFLFSTETSDFLKQTIFLELFNLVLQWKMWRYTHL